MLNLIQHWLLRKAAAALQGLRANCIYWKWRLKLGRVQGQTSNCTAAASLHCKVLLGCIMPLCVCGGGDLLWRDKKETPYFHLKTAAFIPTNISDLCWHYKLESRMLWQQKQLSKGVSGDKQLLRGVSSTPFSLPHHISLFFFLNKQNINKIKNWNTKPAWGNTSKFLTSSTK